jgi:two-component system, OmpR family, sensor kinase
MLPEGEDDAMIDLLTPAAHFWQRQFGVESSEALQKLLLEYIAKEQDHAIQNALVRDLIHKYVDLTKKQQEYIIRIETQKIELEALNAKKNEFLGIAAHDLRNPASIIQVYADMLLNMLNDNLSEKQLDFLQTIYRVSEFMNKLLEDVLDISAIESGTLMLDRKIIAYDTLVQQNLHLNRVLAAQKQITLQVDCAPTLPLISCDPQKIEQVLNNLISNAIKYSHPHTTISVRVFQRAAELITQVQDQGQGIPADELSQIFNTFYRASVRATHGEKSTGLGLAIVKRIVEGHGGMIGVQSEVGQGTTFYFHLPISPEVSA